MSEISEPIDVESNYNEVMRIIDETAIKSNYDPSDITVVGVTKRIEISRIKSALDSGLKVVGEIVGTELKKKLPLIKEHSNLKEIHVVGLMQSNKVKYSIENCNLIQSIQTEKILKLVDKYAKNIETIFPIFLQVDFSSVPKPKGLDLEQTIHFLNLIREGYSNVKVTGIMTIAPLEYEEDQPVLRRFFAKTKDYFDKEIKHLLDTDTPQLSMGMSSDYRIAIEEGSTMVRIGTAIFGPRY